MTVASHVFGLAFVLAVLGLVAWGCVAYCRAWLAHWRETRPPEIPLCEHGFARCPICVGSDA